MNARNSGLGTGAVLTLIFVVLKILNLVDWPWISFNPFEVSVFVIQVWAFWLFLVGVWIFLVLTAVKMYNEEKKKK